MVDLTALDDNDSVLVTIAVEDEDEEVIVGSKYADLPPELVVFGFEDKIDFFSRLEDNDDAGNASPVLRDDVCTDGGESSISIITD